MYLWEQPHRFDPSRGTLRSWLGVLAHHRSVDRVRADVRRTRGESRVEPLDAVTLSSSEVDDELSGTWLAGRVRERSISCPMSSATQSCSPTSAGRTYRQVATELSIPEGTAKSRSASLWRSSTTSFAPLSRDRTRRYGPDHPRTPRARSRCRRGRSARCFGRPARSSARNNPRERTSAPPSCGGPSTMIPSPRWRRSSGRPLGSVRCSTRSHPATGASDRRRRFVGARARGASRRRRAVRARTARPPPKLLAPTREDHFRSRVRPRPTWLSWPVPTWRRRGGRRCRS